MAVTYGYFNSIGGDRRYNAEHMSRYFSGIVSRGILANLRGQFAVTATGTDMSVQVAPGRAFFSDGKWVESDAVESLAISPSDVLLNRIDLVVLRKDRNDIARNVIITIKKGTPAIDPTAPALENTEYVEELCLAQVRINALAEAITGSNITDTRLDKTVCGFVTGVIQQVDTTTLYQQYQAAGQEDRAVNQAAFDTWFNAMKGQLTEDAAGNLQTQIDNHKADFTNPHQVTKEQIGAAGLEYVETQLSNKANIESIQTFDLQLSDKVEMISTYDCFYTKNPFGEVHIHVYVRIKNGITVKSSDVIAFFPTGFRPRKVITTYAFCDVQGEGIKKAVLDFHPRGEIGYYGPDLLSARIICDAIFVASN